MTPLQLIEGSGADAARPTDRLDRAPWTGTASPPPRGSSAVAVVLSFGALDRRAVFPLAEALRAVPMAAREVALSCDVGVRTYARTLTIRLWALEGWRTGTAVERLAAGIARAHGVAALLTGALAASAESVEATLAASDHFECALAPDELAPALDRARALLCAAAPRVAGPGGPVARASGAAGRTAWDAVRAGGAGLPQRSSCGSAAVHSRRRGP